MIDRFAAKNYGSLREVSLELTPFHALIGPNDSGKSTILRGMRTIGEFAGGAVSRRAFEGGIPQNSDIAQTRPLPIELGASFGEVEYAATVTADGLMHTLRSPGATNSASGGWAFNGPPHNDLWSVVAGVVGARVARFDPDALRASSGLVPQGNVVAFVDERGRGLPGVLQSVQGRYYDAFQGINERIRKHFPTIRYVQIVPKSESQLVVEAELTDGSRVPAPMVSEGLLYYLAFAAIPYLAPTPLLLVEEPENGLHPSRIATVINLLREFGEKTSTQIVLATHSPLVINELSPEEVTVVTRPSVEVGTQITPMRKTRNFERRKSTYALGELWLSYADGDMESELVDPRE